MVGRAQAGVEGMLTQGGVGGVRPSIALVPPHSALSPLELQGWLRGQEPASLAVTVSKSPTCSPHGTGGKSEALRGDVTCPGSHGGPVAIAAQEPRLWVFHSSRPPPAHEPPWDSWVCGYFS